jgi:predicted house-cleaning NTP pyrophosphatase (Maf/HAM1 superfamily)
MSKFFISEFAKRNIMTTVWHIMVRVWLASGSSRRQKMLEDIFPNLVCQALEGVDETAEHGEGYCTKY